jgi:uncharacterized membrane protein YtjA (UPF0391 family)
MVLTIHKGDDLSMESVTRVLNRKVIGEVMLSWALTFLVIALIAAALGFGGIAGSASYIAQVLFFVFLVLFIISLIVPRLRPPVA